MEKICIKIALFASLIAFILSMLSGFYLTYILYPVLGYLSLITNSGISILENASSPYNLPIFIIIGTLLNILVGYLIGKTLNILVLKSYKQIFFISLVFSIIFFGLSTAVSMYSYGATINNGNDFNEIMIFNSIIAFVILLVAFILVASVKKRLTKNIIEK
jgi:hypothetical protein